MVPEKDIVIPNSLNIVFTEHWSARYRRRLGIGDSPVELTLSSKPLSPGSIKIHLMMKDMAPEDASFYWRGIIAEARNSSGGLLATSFGKIRFGVGGELAIHLCAIKAAANLAKKLKDDGKHDGPVVYETDLRSLAGWLGEEASAVQEEPQDLARALMAADLGLVAASCNIIYPDELRKHVAEDFMSLGSDSTKWQNSDAQDGADVGGYQRSDAK